jgi:hypothetical protein
MMAANYSEIAQRIGFLTASCFGSYEGPGTKVGGCQFDGRPEKSHLPEMDSQPAGVASVGAQSPDDAVHWSCRIIASRSGGMSL